MGNSENFHWYDSEGKEQHRIIGKNGKERNTNLRDAREHGYYPSVTTVMGIMDKPALTRWLVEQSLKAAWELGNLPICDYSEWRNTLREFDAERQASDAADEGTRIHGVLENHFKGGITDGDNYPIVAEVLNTMGRCGLPADGWLTEKSCVSKEHSFAGKVDLHSAKWIVDFKTKDGDLEKVKCYDDQFRQLAAYREALGYHEAQCANIFISRDTTDEHGHPAVKIVIHKPEQTEKALAEFLAINSCWQVLKGHKV